MTEVGRELDRRARRRIAPAKPSRDRGTTDRRLSDRIDHGWSFGTAVAWLAGIAAVLLLEPAPADPEAASILTEVIGTTMALGLSVTMLGLVGRYRFGLGAAAVTGGLMLAVSIACPVSGHHTFGAWWLGELAIVSGLTGLGVVGYRRATGTGE